MSCDRCDEARSKGMKFCPYCGEPLRSRSILSGDPIRLCFLISIPVVTVLIVAELISMYMGAAGTFEYLADKVHDVYLILPTLMVVAQTTGPVLQAYWIIVIAVITLSFAVIFWQAYGALKGKGREEAERAAEGTSLYWVCGLLGVTYIVMIIIMVIQMVFGYVLDVPSDLPSGDTPDALFSYADAAVWEEVISRLVLIGIPMAVLAAAKGRRDFPRMLLGGFGFSKAAVVLLIISAFLFGYAHSGGWGLEKVLSASVGGFAMGYLYIRFGIHASIAFHFITDYMAVCLDTIGAGTTSMIMLAMMALGLVCLIGVLKGVYRGLKGFRDMPNILADQDSIGDRRD